MPALHVLVDGRKARDFGIGRYILGLTRSLAASGEISLTAFAKPGDTQLFPPNVRTVPTKVVPYSIRELLSLGRVAARVGADVVHWPHYVVPFGTPNPTVVTVHDLMHLTQPEHGSFWKRTYAENVLRHAVQVSARVIAVSEETARQLTARFPEVQAKLEVVWNGVDGVFFSAGNERAAEPETGERYILYCGNDKPHKNLARLLAAFSLLKRDFPGVCLVLAGVPPGSARRREEQARELGILENVRETGFIPDGALATLMAGADVFVLPSLTEGFGLPVLEAMAAGAPVACSGRGSLPEVAGDAALLFDPENPGEIAAAIASLLSSRQRRLEMIERGRRRAAAFTWDITARKSLEIYRRAKAESK